MRSTKVTSNVQADSTWLNKTWRPMVGYTYILICLFDFIIAPVINYIFFLKSEQPLIHWTSLTLSNGGLFHLSMGAILGITSWTRGQEKLSYNQQHKIEK